MDTLGFVGSSGPAFAEMKLVKSGFAESWQGCITYNSWKNNVRVKYLTMVMVLVVMAIVVEVTIATRESIESMQYEKFASVCDLTIHMVTLE
jgi:hypothetical protein